ncbi:MAG: family 43 glycosylhydrolase [Gammaproteobacteria bacterium]
MYTGKGFSDWEIGDVDVFIHDGKYHLFHLIIPNHDYIAHAVSDDGINWRREKNALFVGDPGEWDDDMLWTMHVSQEEDHFVMYYTGLSRKDAWTSQRIGRARSDDLIHWTKEKAQGLPQGSTGPYYETAGKNNPRKWLSFRDPFKFNYDGETYLLINGRAASGPVNRRGCVALAKLLDDRFVLQKPLFIPGVYDDVECPCVFELSGKFYLFGSIREDIKVRYWSSDALLGDYKTYHNNLLLPKGNYAARVVYDGDHKQIEVDATGKIYLSSYYRWPEKILGSLAQKDFPTPRQLLSNSQARVDIDAESWHIIADGSYEVFAFNKPSESLIWEGTFKLEGYGKFGLVIDCDTEGNGYWITIDVINGYVKIRSWSFNETNVHNNFIYESLQANHFPPPCDRSLNFKLIRYGNYLELSIDNRIVLTLIDYQYSNPFLGFYLSSCSATLTNSTIYSLSDPQHEYASQEVYFD